MDFILAFLLMIFGGSPQAPGAAPQVRLQQANNPTQHNRMVVVSKNSNRWKEVTNLKNLKPIIVVEDTHFRPSGQ